MNELNCFKPYDIRGIIGQELDENLVEKIGYFFVKQFNAKKIVVGADARATSPIFKKALIKGISKAGAKAIDLGLTGTEEIYFATRHLETDGGIQVTASHNPIDYNGLKIVLKASHPLSNDNGLLDLKSSVLNKEIPDIPYEINSELRTDKSDYINHLLSYLSLEKITPHKIVVNAGNGAAGPIIDELEKVFKLKRVPVEFVKINHEPNAAFPNGIPNPLLVENRPVTSNAVLEHNADFGVAWDGDFDRCFLFDEQGRFIEGYYIVGLLAQYFLIQNKGNEKIIHDPRLCWNTIAICKEYSGQAIQSKTGHAFLKDIMRKENAIYGGEMSAHHYFRDFGYCDSGMIPWLLILGLLSNTKKKIASLVKDRISLYPSSGEINLKVKNPEEIMLTIEQIFKSKASKIEYIDGLSMSFENWRFNLRMSNTEALLRLNVESYKDETLMLESTKYIISMIEENAKKES